MHLANGDQPVRLCGADAGVRVFRHVRRCHPIDGIPGEEIMKNVRFKVAVAVIAAFGSSLHAQDVRCEKYKLDNGMTVILHQDRSLPVAAINLWYRVGSKDEPVRRSGFAHLFEHLMFMGTERVPGSDFDTIMEAGGGANNATTSSDRTNYFSSGPSSLLPTLLWLDADRLEDLGRTMNQEKLDKQRDVVRNERRQSYENRPYGKADLLVPEMLYPPGHPYHIPVIGTHEDLEAATVADVKDFFAAYYVPNNASLCVAGDFDPGVIKPLIAELFGTIPRGQDPDRRSAGPVRLDGVKRATILDKVQLPMVSLSYHSPATLAEGDAEMDLVASILAEGKTSRLYKRLIYDDKLAAEVSASQWSRQLGSVFQIEILANPGVSLDRIETAVDEEIARFVEKGPSAGELEQRKVTIERRMLESMETIEARADQFNLYEYHWGEPNSFKRDLDRFRNAAAEGVKSWAKRVLTPDARVIIRVLPETPQRTASPRDTRPGPAASPEFKPPTPESFKLANGIPVMLWTKKELPLVEAMVLFRTGEVLSEPASAGAVYLAAAMMDEGAGDRDALQFGDAMQALGADFSTDADHESVRASLAVLKRNFDSAAGLMADALRRPRFDEADWQRVKRLHLEEMKQQEDQPVIVASRVAARLFFGDGPWKNSPWRTCAPGTGRWFGRKT
jgi:zinc protease